MSANRRYSLNNTLGSDQPFSQTRNSSEKMPLNTATKKATRKFRLTPTSIPQVISAAPAIGPSQPYQNKSTPRDHHRRSQANLLSTTNTRRKKPFLTINHSFRSNNFAALTLATATIMTSMPPSSTANAFVDPKLVGMKSRVTPKESSSSMQRTSTGIEGKVVFDKIFELENTSNRIVDTSSSISVATTAASSLTSSLVDSPDEHQYSLRKSLVRNIHGE